MFGISSFAQVPFASLAGTAFIATIDENIGLDDSNSQTWAFLQSITEPVTMTDLSSTAGLFVTSINENFTSDDSSTQLSNYLQSITESTITIEDGSTQQFQLGANITENFGAEDTQAVYFKTNTVGTIYVNDDTTTSSITVMEIAYA